MLASEKTKKESSNDDFEKTNGQLYAKILSLEYKLNQVLKKLNQIIELQYS